MQHWRSGSCSLPFSPDLRYVVVRRAFIVLRTHAREFTRLPSLSTSVVESTKKVFEVSQTPLVYFVFTFRRISVACRTAAVAPRRTVTTSTKEQ